MMITHPDTPPNDAAAQEARARAEEAALAADQADLNPDTGDTGEAPTEPTEATNDRPTEGGEATGNHAAETALAAGAGAGLAPDALVAAATAANAGPSPADPILASLQAIMGRLAAVEEKVADPAVSSIPIVGPLIEAEVNKVIEGINDRLAALEAHAVETSPFLMRVAQFFGFDFNPPQPPVSPPAA